MKYEIIYDNFFIQSINTKKGEIEYKIGNIIETNNEKEVIEIKYKDLDCIKYMVEMNLIFYKYRIKDLEDLLFIKKI